MRYIPHLRRGGELYHYRTAGSRNGISTTEGYRAKGKRAVGVRQADGTYLYRTSSMGAYNSANPGRGRVIVRQGQYSRANTANRSIGNWLSDRGRQASGAVLRKAAGATRSAGNAYVNVRRSLSRGNSSANDIIRRNQVRAAAYRTANSLDRRATQMTGGRGYVTENPDRSETTAKQVNSTNNSRRLKARANKAIEESSNVPYGTVVKKVVGETKSKGFLFGNDKKKEAEDKKTATTASKTDEKTTKKSSKKSKSSGSSKSSKSGSKKSKTKKTQNQAQTQTQTQEQQTINDNNALETKSTDNVTTSEASNKSAETERAKKIEAAEKVLKSNSSSGDHEKGLRSLLEAYSDMVNSEGNYDGLDTEMNDFLKKIKANIDAMDQLEETIKDNTFTDDDERKKAVEDISKIRQDNEALIKDFYKLKDTNK